MTVGHRELDIVVVEKLLVPTRDVTGTERMTRQPRVGDQGTVVRVLDGEHCVVECIDSSGFTVWLADFHVHELAPVLDRWRFQIEEISAGVYRAMGTGPRNMRVESTDTDPDKTLADCREFALRHRE
jgi:hypothetical protein